MLQAGRDSGVLIMDHENSESIREERIQAFFNPAVISGLIPFAVMFHIYLRNYQLIRFTPVFVIACIIMFCSLSAFTAGAVIFRNAVLSFLLSVQVTAMFFLYQPYCKLMYKFMPHGMTASYLILCGAAAFLQCKYIPRTRCRILKRAGAVIFTALLLLIGAQLFRVIPIAIQKPKDIFRDYWNPVVESRLPKPDIYWIHCDGMLGFDAFRKFFRDEQRSFRDFLAGNDFIINGHAEFEAAHRTACAIPILMCPKLYDLTLAELFSTHENAIQVWLHMNRYGYFLGWYRVYDNELYMAFEKRGYEIHIVPDMPNAYIYSFRGKKWDPAKLADIFQLENFVRSVFDRMADLLPLVVDLQNVAAPGKSAFKTGNGDSHIAQQYDIQGELASVCGKKTPKLVVIFQDQTHGPYLYDEDGRFHESIGYAGETDPMAYPPQHKYTVKQIQKHIEAILKNDPDAVIVIQGDHGLHTSSPEEFRRCFGKECRPTELWNSVISAIRIPPSLRKGDENVMLETPLNISRYLINHYVGSNNCQYLKKGAKYVH